MSLSYICCVCNKKTLFIAAYYVPFTAASTFVFLDTGKTCNIVSGDFIT